MRIDWSPLDEELKIWRAARLDLPIWWRDDDAIEPTIQLERLLRLAEDLTLSVHLAIIPKFADLSLVEICQNQPLLVPLVHGWAHQNHAQQGAKKAEFGHERTALRQETALGLDWLHRHFGSEAASIFVPPWNRIAPVLLPDLAEQGYRALSTFTPRQARFAAPGLTQINTHLDPIDWRGGRGLVTVDTLVAQLVMLLQNRRAGRADDTEPLGILTHHLVHDEDIWRFTEACLLRLLDGGARPVNLATDAREFLAAQ